MKRMISAALALALALSLTACSGAQKPVDTPTEPPTTQTQPTRQPEQPEDIPAGTQFYFLRTDGESYMDMRLSDGRECRVEVETGPEGWGSYVNGMAEWDCFDGLLYAG